MSGSPILDARSPAFLTEPACFPSVRVFFGKLVAFMAMGLRSIYSLGHKIQFSSPDVFAMSYGFKMLRVYAAVYTRQR